MKQITHKLNFLVQTFKISFIADLEFRSNLLLQLVNDILWFFTQIVIFEVLFRYQPKIGDWTIDSMRIFMAMFFLSTTIESVLFSDNLSQLSEWVRTGHLDFMLIKPIPSQMVVSLYRMNPLFSINFFLVLGWFIYLLSQFTGELSALRLFLFPILILGSVLILYSLRMLCSTLSVIFVKADFIVYLWFQFMRVGMRPDDMYPSILRYIIKSIVPVAFLVSVPVKWLLFEDSWWWFAGCIFVPLIFFYLTTRFWNFALRKYTSASS